MKKFLSICLVALCSVSAMYAQTTPTPSEATQENVECGSTVKVSATSVNKHFNFDHWEIKKDADGSTITSIQPNDNNSTYGATSGQTTTDGDGKETNELTVVLNHNLIDLVSTSSTVGWLKFEAIFTEENWFTINAITDDASLGTVTQTPNDGKVYHDESAILTANPDNDCIAFVGWVDESGATVSTDLTITISPDPSWTNQSTHNYKAVFAKKKVNIKVYTADSSKGTVAIVPVN